MKSISILKENQNLSPFKLEEITDFDKNQYEEIDIETSEIISKLVEFKLLNTNKLYRATGNPSQLMQYSDGTTSSVIHNGKQISGAAGFDRVGIGFFLPLIVWEVASFITAKHYLKNISNQLKNLNKQIETLTFRQNTDDKHNLVKLNALIEDYESRHIFDINDYNKLEQYSDKVEEIRYYYNEQFKSDLKKTKNYLDDISIIDYIETKLEINNKKFNKIKEGFFREVKSMKKKPQEILLTFYNFEFKKFKNDIGIEVLKNIHNILYSDYLLFLANILKIRILNQIKFNHEKIKAFYNRFLKEIKEKMYLENVNEYIHLYDNDIIKKFYEIENNSLKASKEFLIYKQEFESQIIHLKTFVDNYSEKINLVETGLDVNVEYIIDNKIDDQIKILRKKY